MVGYIFRQSCILRSLRQNFSDLVFSERSSTVPHRICRLSFVVYCQEERPQPKLLISFRKPHRAVSKDTVARWVKSTLANAGINVTSFATHSTRAASTSYSANKAGLSLAQVLKAAGWTNASTFAKFYNKLPLSDNYGHVILGRCIEVETHVLCGKQRASPPYFEIGGAQIINIDERININVASMLFYSVILYK